MADIFISYSRKDSVQALQLVEKLRASGISVWIDRHGIEGAEQWATEIVEGIRACSTFIVLLSPASVASENVLKELSLASEKRKRILPVDLIAQDADDPSSAAGSNKRGTDLPSSFEYSLAGLQRVAISDFDGILRAHKHGVARVTVKDTRKSLIVLPFEDHSPAGEDNEWFADGLAGELIDALGHIKSLRILDRKTSLGLRGVKLRTVEIGKEFNTLYFIEGSVRKFGEQIKISVALLDIETGDYLWQESHKGKFENIFEIQEAVATKVVDGLKLHLTKDEKAKVLDRGTENAEAYELYIKAGEYYKRQTREGFRHAIQLFNDAIRLDPGYANAYGFKGLALAESYRGYEHDGKLLVEAEELVREALRLKPELWKAYHSLSLIYQMQGKIEEAERAAERYVEHAPDDPRSHFTLGFFYSQTGQFAKAIAAFEQAVRLEPDDLSSLFNLVNVCNMAGDTEKCTYWASYAIPCFERHLKLHPDDENRRVSHAYLLVHSERTEEAREAAKSLDTLRDGASLFNTANLWMMLGDAEMALKTFRRSIEAGFRNIHAMHALKSILEEALASLKSTPEYEETKQMVENIEAESAAADDRSSAADHG